MTRPITRQTLSSLVEAYLQTWSNVGSAKDTDFLSQNVQLDSSHRGAYRGKEQVLQHLSRDFKLLSDVKLKATNLVTRCVAKRSVVAAYFFGEGKNGAEVVKQDFVAFGGVLVMEIEHCPQKAYICKIKVQIDWVDGDKSLLSHWTLPIMDRLWQPGDAAKIIVSELDSPWAQIPISDLQSSIEEEIADEWFRYAWSLDKADYSLLSDCFSEKVEAKLPPMGIMQERHALVGTLKAFRMPWPWMKHHGEPIRIDFESEGHAKMIVGRVMPGRDKGNDGKLLYGAHYVVNLVQDIQESSLRWRISGLQYEPGWFSH